MIDSVTMKQNNFFGYSNRVLPVLVVLSLFSSILTSPLSHAQQEPTPPPREPSVAEDLGYGVASAFASLLYSPAKVTYAGLGLITGGLGYILSGGNKDVANEIIYPAVKGNYVVTPKHLQGSEPIYFVGPPPPQEAPQPANAPPPSPAQP